MGIRTKILGGFLVLSLMLLIAGGWSIYELNSVGFSVQNILDDNYKSIHAAKEMKEAIEREDSAILLLLLGRWEKGRSILNHADSLFEDSFNLASRNITITGEKEHLELIRSKYDEHKKLWKRPIVDTDREGNLDWYFTEVHKTFLSVNEAIDELITMNDNIMYQTATDLKNRSDNAVIPGIVAIISSLVFTFIFTYFINYYIVSPIINITDRIEKFKSKRIPFDVKIETNDEIYNLAEAIEHLCSSVNNQEVKQ